MKLTPITIKSQEFSKSLRGYDAEEVKTYLEKLANEIEQMIDENEKLNVEVEELRSRNSEFNKIEKELQDTLIKAKTSSSQSLESTRKQTTTMVKEAEIKSRGLLEKAKEEANEIRNAVITLREERDFIISKLKAMVNTQASILEGKVQKSIKETSKPKTRETKDDFEVDIDDIVNKLL